MKSFTLLYASIFILAASATPTLAPAQAPLAPARLPPAHPPLGQLPIIIMPEPPNNNENKDNNDAAAAAKVPLTDILGTHRSLTTFSSLARQHEAITRLLATSSANTTVLAPLNSAVDALPHKPWEDPRDYQDHGAQAYDGSGGKSRADGNLRRFVEAHLVVVGTGRSWEEGVKAQTLGGRDLWWETKRTGEGEKKVVMPDEVEVDRVASQVSNGEVWILKGVLNHTR